jgi:hypothetical protein
VPGVRTFGPLGVFVEAQNPDGTIVRAPNALMAIQALYIEQAGKRIEATVATKQFIAFLRDLAGRFKARTSASA